MICKRYASIILIFSLIGALGALGYGAITNLRLKGLPVKYAYNSIDERSAACFFITTLRYQEQYLKFIREDGLRENIISMDFPIDNYLENGDKIYIRGYSDDSLLIRFYTESFVGLKQGYIYRGFVTDSIKQ